MMPINVQVVRCHPCGCVH